MKKLYLVLFAAALVPLLAACGSGPKCDDDEAKRAVTSRARDTFKRQFAEAGAPPAVVEGLKFGLENIKFTGSDGLRGARMCQAELTLTGPTQTKKMPIEYSVAKATDGVEITLKLGR